MSGTKRIVDVRKYIRIQRGLHPSDSTQTEQICRDIKEIV